MKKLVFLGLMLASGIFSYSQKYITKEGVIDIHSETSLFTIEASNKKVASVLDASNGNIVASTLVRSFKFKEALVEEHFNENYMESHKFPNAVFKGKIDNWTTVNIKNDGTYSVDISGQLTLHGQARDVKEKGELVVKSGVISASTVFNVSLQNFKIEVEKSYRDRINDDIKLMVKFNYSAM